VFFPNARTIFAERAGRELVPALVCARDRRKRRAAGIAAIPGQTTRLALAQSDVDVVVEFESAARAVLCADSSRLLSRPANMSSTANKALLSRHGGSLPQSRNGVASGSDSKRRWPAEFPSSRLCARVWWHMGSARFVES